VYVTTAAARSMGELNMATPAISGDMMVLRTQGHLLGHRGALSLSRVTAQIAGGMLPRMSMRV
jgi:hypothetical protein